MRLDARKPRQLRTQCRALRNTPSSVNLEVPSTSRAAADISVIPLLFLVLVQRAYAL
jgi:hypothetical protein